MRPINKLKMHIEAMIADEDKVEQVVTVAAGIIVKEGDNGEPMVLLIQRAADDHWPLHFEFPRGKCDKGDGDEPRKCAIREIKEETGLDVEIVQFLGKFVYYAMAGKRKSICYNYECRMKNSNQKVKLSHEHDGYKWITQAGEAELLVHPDQKRYIDQILSKDNPIKNTPENDFTMNNKLDEHLDLIQEQHPIHRRRAIAKRIKGLREKMKACGKTKNPEACKESYNKKINDLQKKLDRLSNLRV